MNTSADIVDPMGVAHIVRDSGIPFLVAILFSTIVEGYAAWRERAPTFFSFLICIASLATVLWVLQGAPLSQDGMWRDATVTWTRFMSRWQAALLLGIVAAALGGAIMSIVMDWDTWPGWGWLVRFMPAAFFAYWAVVLAYRLAVYQLPTYSVPQ